MRRTLVVPAVVLGVAGGLLAWMWLMRDPAPAPPVAIATQDGFLLVEDGVATRFAADGSTRWRAKVPAGRVTGAVVSGEQLGVVGDTRIVTLSDEGRVVAATPQATRFAASRGGLSVWVGEVQRGGRRTTVASATTGQIGSEVSVGDWLDDVRAVAWGHGLAVAGQGEGQPRVIVGEHRFEEPHAGEVRAIIPAGRGFVAVGHAGGRGVVWRLGSDGTEVWRRQLDTPSLGVVYEDRGGLLVAGERQVARLSLEGEVLYQHPIADGGDGLQVIPVEGGLLVAPTQRLLAGTPVLFLPAR
jgi:hypothetical protein